MSRLSPLIFKAYDIRAIYPQELNETKIVPIIKAIYKFFLGKLRKDKFQIVVSADMRISSPILFKTAKDTLLQLGADIIDIGVVSTPTFYFAVWHYGYDAGIQITASHNPKEYNGLKFVINSPKGLIKIGKSTGMEDIKKMSMQDVEIDCRRKGKVTKKEGVLKDEVDYAIKMVGNPKIRKFKIVADPGNAMGGTYIDALFKRTPGTLIKMNFELDGNFPAHQPDPLQFSTLKDLQKRVIEEHADLGLAPDGDGDRLFFIDEKGQIIQASLITAIVAWELLKRHRDETILFDIRNILTVKRIVEENGGRPVITKVGHAYITEELTKTGGVFAGEGSGHYFFRDTGNAESPIPVILTVLKVLSESKKTLSEIVDKIRRSYESREINFEITNAQRLLDLIKDKYKNGNLSELDGVSVTFPDWRFNIRASNTEPLLRLNVEAYKKPTMERKKEELISLIKSFLQQ